MPARNRMILHGYWRSTTSYRVRIALNLKRIAFQQHTHDLRTGAHHDEGYRAVNPQGLVPALDIGGTILTQSPAILEWLEATYPDPPLLPDAAVDAAIVRAMAATIGCDIHPVNNLRILETLRTTLKATPDDVTHWIGRWIHEGFAALESMIAQHGRGFAFGPTLTLADCYLVPQVYSAERFNVDLSPYPRLLAAAERARELPAFVAAHPDRQPDSDPA
ncbi:MULTISPECIES: maleylacetoacetate isomerase [unclassified Sphingomonas]|uniref:maleylacetoacetate isomerase n=1 Tax=Sphingomonas sp. PvP015 TaxID=3156388 RepID=UPI003390A463